MSDERDRVLAVLHAFADGWRALDGEAVAACLDPTATTTVIGTDPGEYTVGSENYRAGWRSDGYPVAAHAFAWEAEPAIEVAGPVAWAHGIVVYDVTTRSGERVAGRMWITTVSRRRDDGWRIAHLHASHAGLR